VADGDDVGGKASGNVKVVENGTSRPALHVLLRRESGPEIGDIRFELWPGERVFVLGANGTGKSALLHKLVREGGTKVMRVDAQRFVGFETGAISMTAAARQQAEKQLRSTAHSAHARYYEDPHHGSQRVSAALFDLIDAEVQRAQRITAAVDEGTDVDHLRAEEAAIARLNRLLFSAQLPISIRADGIRSVTACRGDGEPFDVAALSDGQRAALLLAATVLTAKPGTLLLIDEPERHLHRAISAPLLRDLFAERPDCGFVVSTHEIDLAAEHREARILLTRDYRPAVPADAGGTKPGRNVEAWDLDWLEPGADLPDDLRRDVLGARRRILFVEGTESSLDRALYAVLFPNVSVVHKGTATDVIAATKALRGDIPHWLDACGLIDRDERDEAAAEALRAHKVHVLELNAVEALDLHPEIIAAIAARQCAVVGGDPTESAQAAVAAAVAELATERDRLCARAIEVAVRNEVKSRLPTWKDLLESDPPPITISTAGRLDAEREIFDAAVEAQHLLALLIRYKVRETGAAAATARLLSFRNSSDYRSAVRKLLAEDLRARRAMRSLAPTLATVWPEGAA
jgi:ABC-type cobalamin/Fe3+-siderophores transport system ATPase subunit